MGHLANRAARRLANEVAFILHSIKDGDRNPQVNKEQSNLGCNVGNFNKVEVERERD